MFTLMIYCGSTWNGCNWVVQGDYATLEDARKEALRLWCLDAKILDSKDEEVWCIDSEE